jgi:uncharacterized membrane protein
MNLNHAVRLSPQEEPMEMSRARTYLFGNALGLSVSAFASYFDVYSHAHIFIGTDPWWNPAHLMLYSGFLILAYGVVRGRPPGGVGKMSLVGLVVVLGAAVFNEFWHRVLLYGNPIPEPFPVEPPHAVLAVGFILLGVAALASPLGDPSLVRDFLGRAAVALVSGSLWLIVGGSALYIGGAYQSAASYLFAVGVASFSASLFLAYPAALTGKFGYSTLSYLWFLTVYYVFFVSPADGLPFGVALVVVLDLMLVRGKVRGLDSRYPILLVIALLYGVIYFPILPVGYTLAVNTGVAVSMAGVLAEFVMEKAATRRLVKAR